MDSFTSVPEFPALQIFSHREEKNSHKSRRHSEKTNMNFSYGHLLHYYWSCQTPMMKLSTISGRTNVVVLFKVVSLFFRSWHRLNKTFRITKQTFH